MVGASALNLKWAVYAVGGGLSEILTFHCDR